MKLIVVIMWWTLLATVAGLWEVIDYESLYAVIKRVAPKMAGLALRHARNMYRDWVLYKVNKMEPEKILGKNVETRSTGRGRATGL